MTKRVPMPRFVIGLLAALLVLLWMRPSFAYAADGEGVAVTAVDVSKAPHVTLTVAVDGSVSALPLDERAFTLYVSGEKRTAHLTAAPGDPMQVELLVDTSGSMRGAPLDAAKAAALTLLDTLPKAVRVGVVGFGDAPYDAIAPTEDRAAVTAAINGLQANGETALYDGVIRAASALTMQHTAVVMLTDGKDTASLGTLPVAATALEQSHTSFYGVVLQTPDIDVAAAQALADAAGGSLLQATDTSTLSTIYGAIASQLSASYQMTFTATATGSTGMKVVVHAGDRTAAAEARANVPVAANVSAPSADAAVSSAPTVHVAQEPGVFGQSWVMWLGVAALFFALAVSIGIAMMRSDRPSQLASRSVRRAGRSGTFQQLTQSASGIAERSLDRSGKRRGLERALEHAGVDMRPGEFLVIVATVAFAVFALGLLLGGIIVAAVLAAVVVFGTRLFVAQMADRRQTKFGDQLEQTLPLMAGSLRAGFGLMQALDAVARDMESPTSDEFRRLVSETRLGRDLDAGLDALSERMGGGDVEWVVQAIQIHRQVGGDLAEVLDNVQSTIRDRNQLRRRVKALSGEGRLSAVILLALPVVMFAWIALANPKYLHELTGNGLGIAMLVGAASMMLLGAAWMRRIIRLVF